MKAKFSSGVIFSDSVVKLLMSENSTVMVWRLLSPSSTSMIDGLPTIARKARGTKRSIEMLVSLRSRMVLRTASRIEAKLLASWPISSLRSVLAMAWVRSPSAMAPASPRRLNSGSRSCFCSSREAIQNTTGSSSASTTIDARKTWMTACRARPVS